MKLSVNVRTASGVAVVDCNGRIVFGDEASLLREKVKEVLGSNPRVVINLHEVSYIDSGGLGTLVGLFTSAQSAGGDIKLASLTHRVQDLLQVTKLVTVFDVRDSVEDAVKAFQTREAAAS